ncbi:MAG TPA: thioesterase family protein [Stellaceae bacterium]|nr:thioesterase family protein [Stellaceae bacterium]
MNPSPLALYRTRVASEWIDYNGHMNVAYYMLAFDRATDRLLDHLGLGLDYVRATHHSIYILEAHITYAREVKEGDELGFTTQLIGADAKRLHFFHRMYATGEEYLAATNELLALHVDLAGPKAAVMPDESRALIAGLLAEHSRLPRPEELGRVMSLERRRVGG